MTEIIKYKPGELEPCRHCGSKDQTIIKFYVGIRIRCVCGLETMSRTKKEDALSIWNRRAEIKENVTAPV